MSDRRCCISDRKRQVLYNLAMDAKGILVAIKTHFKDARHDRCMFFEAEDGKHMPTMKWIALANELVDELELAVRKLEEAAEL